MSQFDARNDTTNENGRMYRPARKNAFRYLSLEHWFGKLLVRWVAVSIALIVVGNLTWIGVAVIGMWMGGVAVAMAFVVVSWGMLFGGDE